MVGFFELPKAEVPDESIWHHSERLTEWFEAVEQRRKNPEMQPVEDESGMAQNELTKGLRD